MSKLEEKITAKQEQLSRLNGSIQDQQLRLQQSIELRLKLIGAIAGLKELQKAEKDTDEGDTKAPESVS